MTKFEEIWERRFHVLEEFINEYHCLPTVNQIYKNDNIGSWLNNQNDAYKHGKLSENRIKKLKKLMPGWMVDDKKTINDRLLLRSNWKDQVKDVPIDQFLEGKELLAAIKNGIYDCGMWLQNNWEYSTIEAGIKVMRCYSMLHPYICPYYANLLVDVYLWNQKKEIDTVKDFFEKMPFQNVHEMVEKSNEFIDTLTDREKTVIQLRYGLLTGCPEIYEKIGKFFGVQGERIRQIQGKAFRKLRHPTRRKILFSYGELQYLNLEDKEKAKFFREGCRTIEAVFSKMPEFKNHIIEITEEDLTNRFFKSDYPYDQPIDFEKLSVRTSNTLKRAGIWTIGELLEQTEESLSQIKNMGEKSIKEIKTYIITKELAADENESSGIPVLYLLEGKYYNLEQLYHMYQKKIVKSFTFSIDDLDLSVRTYNCLKRVGIDTVSDLKNFSEEDMMRIRNLGRRSYEELKDRLKENGFENPFRQEIE